MSDSETNHDILPASDALIDVRGLNVRFGHQHVLRDIDLSIPQGQTLAIIGESGCGKTVLMKSIIGLVTPNEGEVLFDRRNLVELSDRELTQQRLRFGFVFQNAALFDSMTVGQNVAFPLRQHRTLSHEEMYDMVVARLEEVGLPSNAILKKPAELSGGMRKRVGLARALIMDPEVLLYDEPTTGLDPIVSDVINELILSTRARNSVTGVVVTHDMKSARKVADRVVMLYPLTLLEEDESQIIFDGSVDELNHCEDRRVRQFVRGEAGNRLMAVRNAA